VDCCPSDTLKTEPGQCGCGTPDTDTDSDAVADCLDACPEHAGKTKPGICGCNIPDADQPKAAGCVGLKSGLLHRYSFNGTGTNVTDSRGTAHGVTVNASLTGSGKLTLPGGNSDQFVDLPNGIVSTLVDASFEAWLVCEGSAAWQRIFDFGSTSSAEGAQGTGRTYLFLTTPSNIGTLRAAFSTSGVSGEVYVQIAPAIATGTLSHVAVVVDDTNNVMSLYLDGAIKDATPFSGHLASLKDVNNWLGRAQFNDPELQGTFEEFRIYGAALSARQIELSFASGPNPAFLP
jgi:hypothetical protein